MKLDPLGFKTYTHIHTDTVTLLKTITGSHFPKVSYSLECPANPHTNPSHLGAGVAFMEWITSWTINPGIA